MRQYAVETWIDVYLVHKQPQNNDPCLKPVAIKRARKLLDEMDETAGSVLLTHTAHVCSIHRLLLL